MLLITKSSKARRDIKTRQYLMERSYARSVRYGFDRARWRGLWKVTIQEYLICAIQNIELLIRYLKKPSKGIISKPFKVKMDQIVIIGDKFIVKKWWLCLHQIISIYNASVRVPACGGYI